MQHLRRLITLRRVGRSSACSTLSRRWVRTKAADNSVDDFDDERSMAAATKELSARMAALEADPVIIQARASKNGHLYRPTLLTKLPTTLSEPPVSVTTNEVTGLSFFDTVKQPSHARALNIAVVGAPNAGKSSLVNRICHNRISAVSPKRNTTRRAVLGVVTRGDVQLVVFDTPGLQAVSEGKMYQRELSTAAMAVASDVDVCLVVVDAAKRIGPAELNVLRSVGELISANPTMQTLLVLNKVDLVHPKHRLLITADTCHTVDGRAIPFADVHFISAAPANGDESDDGIGELIEHLNETAVEREWEYDADTVTDLSLLERAHECIRECLFRSLHREVPYRVEQRTLGWTTLEDGTVRIDHQLVVISDSHKSIIIGAGAKTINHIITHATNALTALIGSPVKLNIGVTVNATRNEQLNMNVHPQSAAVAAMR